MSDIQDTAFEFMPRDMDDSGEEQTAEDLLKARFPIGAHKVLNYTPSARYRVLVGVSWDPAGKARMRESVEAFFNGTQTYHDLDLACFAFDKNKKMLCEVSPEPAMTVDDTAMIFHSGDNEKGYGPGDDEHVSACLRYLPEEMEHLLFTVKIQSGQVFGEIDSPGVRVADGMSNEDFLITNIDHPEGRDSNIFVFAHIYRTDVFETGWVLAHVSRYMNSEKEKDWKAKLPSFIEEKDLSLDQDEEVSAL